MSPAGEPVVVAQAIHHHLADDGPQPVRLGRPEGDLRGRLVDGRVDDRGRRPGGGEGPEGGRGQPLGVRLVELALHGEDVALEPGQQVQAGAEARVRELGQVGMEVDHAGQHEHRAQVDERNVRPAGRRGLDRPRTRGTDRDDAAIGPDLDHAVRLVARAAGAEGRQDAGSKDERWLER